MRVPARLAAAGVALCASLGALSGCTATPPSGVRDVVPLGAYRMVSFDSCEEALTGLRAATRAAVGPYGLNGIGGPEAATDASRTETSVQSDAKAAAPKAEPAGSTPDYSGTNTHEAGVDEPDLVKTDGRRIVTVTGNAVTVVDAVSRSVTARIPFGDVIGDDVFRYVPDDLLLSGDQALVLMRYPYRMDFGTDVGTDFGATGGGGRPPTGSDKTIPGPRLVLVSLAGPGRVLSSVTADGNLIDARQVGSTARVVIRSAPRLTFPYQENQTDAQRLAANQGIVDQAPLDTWLPRIETTTGNATRRVSIDCDAISRPAVYSGTNLVTVLSFNLGANSLGEGQPTTLVADGETVYSNGPSLYVASGRNFGTKPMPADVATPAPVTTEIYRFDTSTARPTFAAGGSVPGYLVNQYAMSDWDGTLRVATTTPGASGRPSGSGVYALAQQGRTLKVIGSVEGLGKNEQIYAVRFVGPTAYVVTFRQTDPLYTVDLKDPAAPAVRGELKIPGYSAYLHPAGDHQLIGIGQNATDQGRVTGTQVSLFDIGNLANPARIAHYTVSGAHSDAEFDPHAFLFWPKTGLLVVPLQSNAVRTDEFTRDIRKVSPEIGALVLRVSGQSIQEVGFIQHPAPPANADRDIMERLASGQIRRSLVIGQTLWTVSSAGLMASDLTTLKRQGWVAFA